MKYTSKQAADYLKYEHGTLNASRYTGKLGGIPAPKFKKLPNGQVRYDQAELDRWLAEFEK